MKTHDGMTKLVGNTPLVSLSRYASARGIKSDILGKLEMFNPSGSVKDRAALSMIEDAEARGLLGPGSVIVEPTSGNTGIALAWIARARGYRCIIAMPETMSEERRALMRAYGAELVLTPGPMGMKGSIARASELAAELPNSFIPNQFENMANPAAHERTTGPEIWRDADGRVDVLVSGVGTGGTLSGAGKYLKAMNPNLKVVAVEPAASPVLSGGAPGPHKLQGIGAGFVPGALDRDMIYEVITVESDDAFATCKELAATEGILCGISSGAALWAAAEFARRADGDNLRIAVILPDTGTRYLSVPGYL